MQIEAAKFESGKLILSTTSPDAARFVFNFKAGDYEISPAKKKRSLNANAYMWELCAKISEAIGIPKDTIYANAIYEGNQYEVLYMIPDAVDSFRRVWGQQGLGWGVVEVDQCPDGTVMCFAYYGSSAYDTKAMSRLIDSLVQECHNLGIETRSQEEINSLLEGWK